MSASERNSKANQRALSFLVDQGCAIFSRRAFTSGVGDSSRKISEFAVSKARVRGNAANILSLRYRAVKPKKERALTWGQPPTSATSAADHTFISSEIMGSLGRGLACFTDSFLPPPSAR